MMFSQEKSRVSLRTKPGSEVPGWTVGLDNVTSAMCKHQQWFGLDVQCSALVLNFNIIFSNGHLHRAGEQ
jgi:hypothetical protein